MWETLEGYDISPVVKHPVYPAFSAVQAVIFSTGVVVGGTDEFLTNWGFSMPCIADISRIFEIGFMLYLYSHEFHETNDS